LLQANQADALVVHCSDPRFQAAFREFVAGELQVLNPVPIIIPGGIHELVSPVRIKAARQLWQQLEFMISAGKIRRVIIINHEGCQWYAKWNALVRTRVSEDIVNHLLAAAQKLLERRLNLSVETYYAKIENDGVVFSRLNA
jgi:carbonic anhydrase